jgi:hypothetical protein
MRHQRHGGGVGRVRRELEGDLEERLDVAASTHGHDDDHRRWEMRAVCLDIRFVSSNSTYSPASFYG